MSCRVAISIAIGMVAGWTIAAFMWAPIVDFWKLSRDNYKDLYEYSYEGSIQRGYTKLCERSGEVGIWFLDECDPS